MVHFLKMLGSCDFPVYSGLLVTKLRLSLVVEVKMGITNHVKSTLTLALYVGHVVGDGVLCYKHRVHDLGLSSSVFRHQHFWFPGFGHRVGLTTPCNQAFRQGLKFATHFPCCCLDCREQVVGFLTLIIT